jgi:hypothetical protein
MSLDGSPRHADPMSAFVSVVMFINLINRQQSVIPAQAGIHSRSPAVRHDGPRPAPG